MDRTKRIKNVPPPVDLLKGDFAYHELVKPLTVPHKGRTFVRPFLGADRMHHPCYCEATNNLGDIYKNGHYVEQNEQHAIHLYIAAMNVCMSDDYHGDAIADIDLRLGTAFLHSNVLEHNPENALFHLNRALTLFYQRRKTDPFVAGLIRSTKELIAEALQELDEEVI